MNQTNIPARRDLLVLMAIAPFMRILPAFASDALPTEVAGISIPSSAIAVKAAAYARTSCPEFLFNHCMRTFLFGALSMNKLGRTYNADQAFVAAALHDLGLIKAFESVRGSFEVDGANIAEQFALGQGMTPTEADTVWHAIVFHDGRRAITERAGTEAMLVAAGAAADVDGPDDDISKKIIDEIVAAFPRLQFKARFTQLTVDHCVRKPLSQRGTWLEGLCRERAPAAFSDTVEQEIIAAPFAE